MAQVNNAAATALSPAAAGLDFSAPPPAEAAPGFPEEFLGALEEFSRREQAQSPSGQDSAQSPPTDPAAALIAAQAGLQILPPGALAAAAQAANLALDTPPVAPTELPEVGGISSAAAMAAGPLPAGPLASEAALVTPLPTTHSGTARVDASSGSAVIAVAAGSPATQSPEAVVTALAQQVSSGAAAASSSMTTATVTTSVQHTPGNGSASSMSSTEVTASAASSHLITGSDDPAAAPHGAHLTAGGPAATSVQTEVTALDATNGVSVAAAASGTEVTAGGTARAVIAPTLMSVPGATLGGDPQQSRSPERTEAVAVAASPSQVLTGTAASTLQSSAASPDTPSAAGPVSPAVIGGVAQQVTPAQMGTSAAPTPTSGPASSVPTTAQASDSLSASGATVDVSSMRVMALDISKEASAPVQAAERGETGPASVAGAFGLSGPAGSSPQTMVASQGAASSQVGAPSTPGADQPVSVVQSGQSGQSASVNSPASAAGYESILDPSAATLDQRSTDAARARQASTQVPGQDQQLLSAPVVVGPLGAVQTSAAVASVSAAVASMANPLVPTVTRASAHTQDQTQDQGALGTSESNGSLASFGAAESRPNLTTSQALESAETQPASRGISEGVASEGIVSSTTATGTLVGGDASSWVSSFTQALMGNGIGLSQSAAPQPSATPLPSHSAAAPLPPHLVAFDTGPVQLEISKLVRQGGGQVVMELTPPDEGRFRVDLRIDSQGTATLIVEGVSDSTRSRLEQSAPDLREQFAQMGLQLDLNMRGQRESSESSDQAFEASSSGSWDSRGADEHAAVTSRPDVRRRAEVHTGQVHLYA